MNRRERESWRIIQVVLICCVCVFAGFALGLMAADLKPVCKCEVCSCGQ